MSIMGVLEPTLTNGMLAVTAMWWPWYTRLVYNITRSEKEEGYVLAAEVIGASRLHVMLREILPNCIPSILTKMTLDLGFVILIASSLSFLGLGVQAADRRTWDRWSPRAATYLPEFLVDDRVPRPGDPRAVFGFNLVGDAMRGIAGERPMSAPHSPHQGSPARLQGLVRHGRGAARHLHAHPQGRAGGAGRRNPAPASRSRRASCWASCNRWRSAQVSGLVEFEGQDLGKLSEREHARLRGTAMSMIFQDPTSSLNPVYTIGVQFHEVLRRRNPRMKMPEARERAAKALTAVAIPNPERVLDSYSFQLSGGMNQRVMIAMALANEPSLLLADEPGTALDVTIQAQTLRLMRDLVEEHNTSVLFISHNLGVVREFADRVYVIYKGRIVEHGPADRLFEDPRHPYTRASDAGRAAPDGRRHSRNRGRVGGLFRAARRP